jgi:hypothetical protein
MEYEFYIWGVWISFLHWLFQSVFLILLINSRLEKNLNKVSQRLSWLGIYPKPIESIDQINPPKYKMIFKYVFLRLFNLFFIFLSWLYLFYLFVNIIFNRYKRDGEPEVMKTFRWRMRNQDLTYDQILAELYKTEFTDKSYDEFKYDYEKRVKIFLGDN